MDTACPHCKTASHITGNFCESCGNAIPSRDAGPRTGPGKNPSAAADQTLQLNQLARQMRAAFRALLGVGIFQCVIGGGLAALASLAPNKANVVVSIGVWIAVIGVVFLALSAWARKSPLPAAVTGMVLFVSLWVLDSVVGVMNGDPAAPIWIIKLIVVAALGRAISAGVKYSQLRREVADDSAGDNDDDSSGLPLCLRPGRTAA